MNCSNCGGEFGEFLYHQLLNNTLWCEKCAREAFEATGKGNDLGTVSYIDIFARAPTSTYPLLKLKLDTND